MEVVVLLVAVVGVTFLVVPRLRRRRAGAHRPAASKARPRTGSPTRLRGPKAAAAAGSAPAVASWTPPPSASSDVDVWEDDLGWEGESAEPTPAARDAWEDWREAALSPAEPSPEPEVRELPSVERWRARADEEPEWVEDDDDGLGWE